MLFMGQEMLEDAQFGSSTPLDWNHANTYSNVVNYYRDMIHLRRNLDGVSHGLTGPNISWHVVRNDAPWKLLAFHRWGAGPDDQVMVVMNFTVENIPSYIFSGWPENGTWYVNLNLDWPRYGGDFSDQGSSVVQVSNGTGEIAIGPYSALVLSRKALPWLDSDHDGLLNGWEQEHFGNPLDASATADSDGDGANNLNEQQADTDPNSAASVLKFIHVSVADGEVDLQWIGGMNARQVLQQSSSLLEGWTDLHTNTPPTPLTNSLSLPAPDSGPSYFRINAAQ
jgi:1,4-alpha-glucan branching enzyme